MHAHSSFLSTTEDLEYITLVQVDSRTALDFRSFTIAATEHVKSRTEHIHTLLTTYHT